MYHVHGRKITDDAGKPREQETLMRGLEGGIRKNTASQQFAGCPPYEEFGKEKDVWLKTILELPNGIPSHDTFERVFARINPVKFEACFFQWVQSISETITGVIAIDDKMLRRSHDQTNGKSALHMVSAWSAENRLVLAQVAVEKKSNEIMAIPLLLEQLPLSGCIVTIDAMGMQVKIATQIIDQEGDYVLALKGNQGVLSKEVKKIFDLAQVDQFAHVQYAFHETVEKGHGRIEIRRHWLIDDPEHMTYLNKKRGMERIKKHRNGSV